MRSVPMRSIPPGRCPRCVFPREACLCPDLARIPTRFRFLVLRHASEIPRLTNSARWAALALEGAEIVDYALPGHPLDAAQLSAPGTVLLFPSARPAPPPAVPPRRIVVPDGTWAQARRMVHRVPALQALPRLSLPPAPQIARLRRAPAGGMSTAEAIAAALRLLGDGAAAEALLSLHAVAVDRASRLHGTPIAFAAGCR